MKGSSTLGLSIQNRMGRTAYLTPIKREVLE
jgi:hypothetical protein